MKYVVLAIFLVLMAGIFHMLFVVFDYAYNDPTRGAFSMLQDDFNESHNDTWDDWYEDHNNLYMQFFGIGRVGCIFLAILFAVVGMVSKYREGSEK